MIHAQRLSGAVVARWAPGTEGWLVLRARFSLAQAAGNGVNVFRQMKNFLPLPLLLCACALHAGTSAELALRPYTAPPAPRSADWPREKLLGFMRELADFVEQHHVVTDPVRKTYGMTYEFWKDGKQIQEFGLDSLHDGAWFMSALIVAQRADPHGDWLSRAQKYQVPFYTNLLNHSDRLFPKMQPTDEDKHPWPAPLKGWAPRGWDDGKGYALKDGSPLAEGYFTASNHLSEDLADALLNVWLSTRDPAVAEAAQHLRDYKDEYYGPIQGVDVAAAAAAGQPEAFLKFKLPEFTPRSAAPMYPGVFERKAMALLSYDDTLAWQYRQGTAAAWISGEFPRSFAAHLIARCYGALASMETFFDDQAYPYGVWFFDIQRPPAYVEGKGKLNESSSTSKAIFGPRGVQLSWLAAAAAAELKAQPELWDQAVKLAPGEIRVRMVDEPPITDGAKDEIYGKAGALGDDSARVWLVSDPRNLHLFLETTRPQVSISFHEETGAPHPADNGRHKREGNGAKEKAEPADASSIRGGKVTVSKDGHLTAVNPKGEALLAAVTVKPGEFKQGAGESWVAEMRIPYTFVPAQNEWINGVDFGRYRIGIDNAPPQTICILSDSARVRKRLENLALGSIAYWHEVWTAKGMIPSGWHSATASAGRWELSDTGGYAHLIHAMALWLIYQDGRRECEVIRDQYPATAQPAPPLPESVLTAQGLK